MIKKDSYTYSGGMNMDLPPSKRAKDQYFMLRNGRITSSYSDGDNQNIGTHGAVKSQSGNEPLFAFTSLISISGAGGNITVLAAITAGATVNKQFIFTGKSNSEIVNLNSLLASPDETIRVVAVFSDGPYTYFLTTSDSGIDCIWKYSDSTTVADGLELLYINALGWNQAETFDIVVNTESESVIKMYIADGIDQIFSLNILNGADIDKPKKVLYMVPQYNVSQPYVKEQVAGGEHIAGSIQYAYNLFNRSGGQTKLSPASELVYMGKGSTLGGGSVNEVVGMSNIVEIDNIDTNYDYIRLYSIKYSDLNTVPIVSVVDEFTNTSNGTLIVTDDGRVKYPITLEALTFLGGTDIIPRAIVSKKNRLIMANITENVWDVNDGLTVDSTNYFDPRAYSSPYGSSTVVISSTFGGNETLNITGRAYTSNGLNVPANHDCKQDKDVNLYVPSANTTAGGEGRHIAYTVDKSTVDSIVASGYNNFSQCRHMKCGEVYRWGIEFYNAKSQKSTPQWIADVKVPNNYYGFADNTRVTISFTISSEGAARLAAQGVIGYKFVRVERKEIDRTIIAQGIATPMIFQEVGDNAHLDANESQGAVYNQNNAKISSPWVRHLQSQVDVLASAFSHTTGAADVKINAASHNACISPHMTVSGTWDNVWPWTEIFRDSDGTPAGASRLHISYQDTKMLQVFSPESIFGQPVLNSGMKYRVAGTLKQTARSVHGKMLYVETRDLWDDKTRTTIANLAVEQTNDRGANPIHYSGYIGPNHPHPGLSDEEDSIRAEQLIHYYREYQFQTALSAPTTNTRSILGAPELGRYETEVSTYSNNGKFKYTNSLQSILADGRSEWARGSAPSGDAWDVPLYGIDAIAAQNITFVDANEKTMETIFSESFTNAGAGSPTANDNVLLVEIINDIDNQYGGNSYEDRSINKYIGAGKYQTLSTAPYRIVNSGDTFVGTFKFARIARIDGVQLSENRMQMTEIVSIPVETTVNIAMRNDKSLGAWNSSFLPTNDEYHKYNSVYSQEANAIYSMPDPFLFVKNTEFTNRILASKPKISGETIDSWLDVLVNEEIYLEGEYGAINRMVKFSDTLYVFQRDGVAVVSVLPRVQLQGSDAIGIELGVGQALSTYQYINTNSGCADFDGIVSTSSAVYYGDRIRRTINIIDGVSVTGLSDSIGLSSYVKGYDTSLQYKPYYNASYDPITDDVFFTITRQSSDDTGSAETLVYNERMRKFTSILDLPASFIFTMDGKMHSISKNDESIIWNHFIGHKTCNFYGTQYDMELTLVLNPEQAENDCLFNTIEWTHDIVDSNNPNTHYNENITGFSSWSDYLTANDADVSTIQRRFRMSRLFIPRSNSDNLSRMRGHYLYAKFKYNPVVGGNFRHMILNDIILYYNAQR